MHECSELEAKHCPTLRLVIVFVKLCNLEGKLFRISKDTSIQIQYEIGHCVRI